MTDLLAAADQTGSMLHEALAQEGRYRVNESLANAAEHCFEFSSYKKKSVPHIGNHDEPEVFSLSLSYSIFFNDTSSTHTDSMPLMSCFPLLLP